jgi:hypothetical protein
MIRRAGIFLVCFCAYLILLAETQRQDEVAKDQIEQLQLERVARVSQ